MIGVTAIILMISEFSFLDFPRDSQLLRIDYFIISLREVLWFDRNIKDFID